MPQSSRLNVHTILVVDDDAIIRMMIADFLNLHHIEVLEAGNADEAIELLDRHAEIEILVTDVEMPGSMDGVRLAHHVRNRWPPIRILVISGNRAAEWRDLPDKTVFLHKPFMESELWSALSGLAA